MLLAVFEVTCNTKISLCGPHINRVKPYTLCHPDFLQRSFFLQLHVQYLCVLGIAVVKGVNCQGSRCSEHSRGPLHLKGSPSKNRCHQSLTKDYQHSLTIYLSICVCKIYMNTCLHVLLNLLKIQGRGTCISQVGRMTLREVHCFVTSLGYSCTWNPVHLQGRTTKLMPLICQH